MTLGMTLGSRELPVGPIAGSLERLHRLLEELERELGLVPGAAAYPEGAAVVPEVGSYPDAVVAVAAGLDLPAQQTKPQVENLAVHACRCLHRRSLRRVRRPAGRPAAPGTLTVAQILSRPGQLQLSLDRWFTTLLHPVPAEADAFESALAFSAERPGN